MDVTLGCVGRAGQVGLSARLSETADVIQDGAELSMFCQMHKCSEYCLR